MNLLGDLSALDLQENILTFILADWLTGKNADIRTTQNWIIGKSISHPTTRSVWRYFSDLL